MKVSVCTLTYNHKTYIEQCIESALAQNTNFEFEIIIGDDGSDDGTSEICMDYARRYSKIRHILQDRKNIIYINGRPTGRYNFISVLGHMQGQYIAMLDGDDYWTASGKLQTMVDFLDRHPDFSFAFHKCEIEENGLVRKDYLNENTPAVVDLAYLARYGNCMRTMSVVFRNRYRNEIPGIFYTAPVGDYPLHIHNSRHGKGKFIDKSMGVYRKHQGGIWSSYKSVEMKKEWLGMLEKMSKQDTRPAISTAWNQHMAEIAFSIGNILEKEKDINAAAYFSAAKKFAPEIYRKAEKIKHRKKSFFQSVKEFFRNKQVLNF